MTSFTEQQFDQNRVASGVRNASCPVRLSPKLIRLASGWPVMVLPLPAGLAERGSQPVTLYTPDGPQPRTLRKPRVVDIGRPNPVEAPVSTVTGTGRGLWLPEVEVVVSEGAGGHAVTSYVGKIWDLAADGSGNVWVATDAALSRFDGQHWTTFTEADYPICAPGRACWPLMGRSGRGIGSTSRCFSRIGRVGCGWIARRACMSRMVRRGSTTTGSAPAGRRRTPGADRG